MSGLAGKGGNGRNVPKFEEVTDNSTVKDVNPGTDTSTSVSPKYDVNEILPPENKIEKKQVSIYLDTDVITALNKFGKARGKGAKSELVNNFLKQAFNIRQGEQDQ